MFTPEQRKEIEAQLARSYEALSATDRTIFHHASGMPTHDRDTGKALTFPEVLQQASDSTLDIWLDDFKYNGLLVN